MTPLPGDATGPGGPGGRPPDDSPVTGAPTGPGWRPARPRRLEPGAPVIASAVVPSGPGPLVARFVPPAAGQGGADVEISADLVFRVTEADA